MNSDTNSIVQKLNAVSASFCIAKWKQVTLHLATGQTHSCHHPSTHHIPIEEIKIDVSALHNTKYKKVQRQKMIEGIRPNECNYCWRIEDTKKDVLSDRFSKSSEKWALPYIDEIISDPLKNIYPSYLEISFSNVCNFACSYCSPEISSQWMEEINKYGHYPTSTQYNNIDRLKKHNKLPIPERDNNPYVDAFWTWWPDIYKHLRVLRITGGEPLLSKHTTRILEWILNNPHPNLEVAINSNLCVPHSLLENFLKLLQQINISKSVSKLEIYTSCDAHGIQAEYIRHGLNYKTWLSNCNYVLQTIPTIKLTITSTYNALSVTSFIDFLKDCLELKCTYNTNTQTRVLIDIPYLRMPEHLSIKILDDSYKVHIENQITYMYKNMQHTHWPPLSGKGFEIVEIEKLKKIYWIFCDILNKNDNITIQKDFILFVDEYDKRRNTNFNKVFPEMQSLYNKYKML